MYILCAISLFSFKPLNGQMTSPTSLYLTLCLTIPKALIEWC